jgi:hypothetical protein
LPPASPSVGTRLSSAHLLCAHVTPHLLRTLIAVADTAPADATPAAAVASTLLLLQGARTRPLLSSTLS